MIFNNLKQLPSYQSGAVTLFISIVLLVGVTLITVFAARIGVMDQRIAGNEYRHKEAQAAADAALDQAASFITNNAELYDGTSGTYTWVDCTSGSFASQFPCANKSGTRIYDLAYDPITATTTIESLQEGGKSVALASGIESQAYLTYTTSGSVGNILTAIGTGKSLDETGQAYAQNSYTQISLLTPGEIPPIMTPIIKLSGSFTIVADPNGGGPGVPVSAWVSTIDTSGGTASWQTCQLGSYRDGADICSDTLDDTVSWKDCSCVVGETLSDSSNPANYDLVEVGPGDFPDSPFQYLFPTLTGYADVLTIPDILEITDCSDLDTLASTFNKATLVAVSGSCSIPANSIVASRDGPILLVVRDDLSINSNTDLFGIAFGFQDVSLNGTATIHGSLIAEDSTNLSTGGYTQVYDEFVLGTIAEDLETFGLAKQKYSWIDIQP